MAATMKPLIVACAVTELDTLSGGNLEPGDRSLLREILAKLPGNYADMFRATIEGVNKRMAVAEVIEENREILSKYVPAV